MIKIDNSKAIEITKQKIREYRDPILKSLDLEFQRSLETQTDPSAIVAKKQELRDMPTIADGKTIGELKAIIKRLNDEKVLT